MGRLTEAFGFINVEPSKFNGLWVQDNMTSLSVTPALKKIRLENLSLIRKEKKEVISNELKEREKKLEVMDYLADLQAMEMGLISKKQFELKHGSLA